MLFYVMYDMVMVMVMVMVSGLVLLTGIQPLLSRVPSLFFYLGRTKPVILRRCTFLHNHTTHELVGGLVATKL